MVQTPRTSARPPRFTSLRRKLSSITGLPSQKARAAHRSDGPHVTFTSCRLADRLVRAVALDLVDPEVTALEVPAHAERDGQAEHRRLEPRLREVAPDFGTRRT